MNNWDREPNFQQPRAPKSYKKWGIAAVCVLAALIALFTVPAHSVPGLSRLVTAMGHNEADGQTMSIAKALFSWTADTIGLGEGERYEVFSRNTERDAYGEKGPPSKLFSIRSLNRSLTRRGKKADALKDSAFDGRLNNLESVGPTVAVSRKIQGLSPEAQSAINLKGESYFGEDAQQKELLQAYGNTLSLDTSKMLKKNTAVVGSVKVDPLSNYVDKLTGAATTDVDKALRGSVRGGSRAVLNTINEEARSMRDLEFVLLMSNAANRAPQPVLKKTLAVAGFINAELPKKVFDSSGSVALPKVDNDAIVRDLGTTKDLLKREDKCRTTAMASPDVLLPAMTTAKELTGSLAASFPKSCSDTAGINNFRNNLNRLKSICNSVQGVYINMQRDCGMGVKTQGTCATGRLDSQLSGFLAACQQNPEEVPNLNAVEKDVEQSFNIPVGKNEDVAENADDFFPESEISNSQFL